MVSDPQGPEFGISQLEAIYPYGLDEPAVFLELTFGHVVASRRLLGRNPNARLVLFSPDLAREGWAREQMRPLAGRVRFVRADPSTAAWVKAMPGGFHLVCVSWGLEEVATGSRAELLGRLAGLLRPGGLLCVMAAVASPSEQLLGHYRRALGGLVGGLELPPVPALGAHPVTEGQLRFWLEGAGLGPVDLFWKLGPYVLVVGMRGV